MCSSQGTAIGTILIENQRIRTTKWHFPKKGDNTGWHRHEYDYVVIPLFDGVLEMKNDEGWSIALFRNGDPYFNEAGVEHDVINGNDFECAFIEVELLEEK